MVFMTSSQSGAIGRFKNIAKHRIGNPGSQSTRPPTGAACDIDSSWNAFCIALRGAGHGVAMGYGQELDHPLRAGAIIDLYPRFSCPTVLFDDDLGVAGTARGGKQNQCC